MVKKLHKSDEQKPAAASGLLDSQLAQTVKDSAQQIWLAGLGAFAKAQGSGGKVFETLMKEGANLQRLTQTAAGEKLGEKFGDVADRMTAMAGEVGHKANAQWDKLESIFEERTARALGRLGVPSAKELAALTRQWDALSAQVEALSAAVAELQDTAASAAKVPKFRPGKALKAGKPSPASTSASTPAPTPTPAPAARRTRAKPKAAAPAVAAPAPAEPAVAAAPAKRRRAAARQA